VASASPSPLADYVSPKTLNDEAGLFALASSGVRLNQLDPTSAPFVHNIRYQPFLEDGQEDEEEVTQLGGNDAAVKLTSGLTAGGAGKGKPLPFGDVLRIGMLVRGDGGTAMNTSFAHRFVRGLLGDDGLCVYIARFLHYFGFFHLALLSLLCASYSNAPTLFSLYYIGVTGWLSVVGTRTANRYWRPLTWTLTLCLTAKYAVALANQTPNYTCDNPGNSNSCTRWIMWLGKGTTLYYWSV